MRRFVAIWLGLSAIVCLGIVGAVVYASFGHLIKFSNWHLALAFSPLPLLVILTFALVKSALMLSSMNPNLVSTVAVGNNFAWGVKLLFVPALIGIASGIWSLVIGHTVDQWMAELIGGGVSLVLALYGIWFTGWTLRKCYSVQWA